jgi:hypothetical protein
LCCHFVCNFRATCKRSGVDWDLASIMQKKGESLQEFIQRFFDKRNIIPEVDDKSIRYVFQEGTQRPLFDPETCCEESQDV